MADVSECIEKLAATGTFTRAEQSLRRQGSDFWWPQGSTTPQRGPNF
jgi:hypothetical protein